MDRRTVLERLDVVRPSSHDLSLPEMAEARNALRNNPELAEEFTRRQQFDMRIAAAMHDVIVPENLQPRLLQRLQAESAANAENHTAPPEETKRLTRRGTLALIGALAASVVAGGIYWSVATDSMAPVSIADLENSAARFLSASTKPVLFEGQFVPRPPREGRWNRLRFDRQTYGLLPTDQGHRAAAWRFSWNGSHGVLIAIPRESVATPPDRKRDYAGGNTVAWTEQDFVYVCQVDGRIDELLRRIDEGRLA